MEIFGIFLSIPVAFAASMLYCRLLGKIVSRSGRWGRWLRLASKIVLGLFAIELVMLATLGAVRSRAIVGPSFYVAHILFFFLGTPALANLLILRTGGRSFSTWYVAATICTVFAFLLVLLQYSVSESLYGIDGDDGPYSSLHLRNHSRSQVKSARYESLQICRMNSLKNPGDRRGGFPELGKRNENTFPLSSVFAGSSLQSPRRSRAESDASRSKV